MVMPPILLGLLAFLFVTLPAQADGLLSRNGLEGSRLAYILEDADSGERIEERDAARPMVPASTIKLITAIAALDLLGPEHRLATHLLFFGQIDNKRLEGDLIIEGGGDVELDMDDLMELALSVRSAGIDKVDGRFLVDDTKFLRVDSVNPKQPLDAPYNAGIGPLALAFSRVTMVPDGKGHYQTLPPLVERGPAWSIVANARPNRPRPIPVRDVGMHAARTLAWLMRSMGIEVPEPVRAQPPENSKPIATIESKPVAELVEDMLLYSNNQVAETLGLAVIAHLGLRVRTLEESARILAEHVIGKIDRGDWQNFYNANHSGLSPKTRVSVDQLGELLRFGLEHHAMPEMLATSGWSGSLLKRLKNDPAALRVWAKTGSLDFVSALAGYLLADGKLRIFALMIADEEARAAYDALDIPTPAMRKAAQEWEVRAKKLQDELILGWLKQN